MTRLAHCENVTSRREIVTFAQKAAAVGAGGICLRVDDALFHSFSDTDVSEIAKLNAVRCVSIEWTPPLPDFQVDREASVRFRAVIAGWLQWSASLGAKILEIRIAPTSCDPLPILVDHLLSMRFDAQHHAVRMAICVSGSHGSPSVSEFFGAMDRVNSPWVGLSLHIKGANGSDSLENSIERLTHRIALIRLDASATGRDLESVSKALQQCRQSCPVVGPLDSFSA